MFRGRVRVSIRVVKCDSQLISTFQIAFGGIGGTLEGLKGCWGPLEGMVK